MHCLFVAAFAAATILVVAKGHLNNSTEPIVQDMETFPAWASQELAKMHQAILNGNKHKRSPRSCPFHKREAPNAEPRPLHPEVLKAASRALELEAITKRLRGRRRYPRQTRRPFSSFPKVDLKRIVAENSHIIRDDPSKHNLYGQCPIEQCIPDFPFRTFNGLCNNLQDHNYGKAVRPLARLLPALYDDGLHQARTRSAFSRGNFLPNPRAISVVVHSPPNLKDENSSIDQRHTLALMQWGQLVDHDLTSTPMHRGINGQILDCTSCDSPQVNGGCDPIRIPRGDPYYPRFDPTKRRRKCIPFIRSLPGQNSLGAREQLNQISAYLDSSHLYGSFWCRNIHLRDHEGGRMKTLAHPKSPSIFKPLMPQRATNPECRSASKLCFDTGDDRNSEQPGLTGIHTLLLREHNRLADQLSALNPHWEDERVFQEARKIVTGINQHVTYSEFLPRVLGPEIVAIFGLSVDTDKDNNTTGYYKGYNDTCSADITNSFASAAFRFGHTLIRSKMSLSMSHREGKVLGFKEANPHLNLKDHFNNPDVVFNTKFVDHLLGGLVKEPMSHFDQTMSTDLLNHLFEEHDYPFSGVDLAALDIKRGRDHGLQGYTKYHNLCARMLGKNGTHIRDFADLEDIMGKEAAVRLSRVYRHVDDIDLFSGGLSELPVVGGVIGPTFGCIIGEQFQRLRDCDRFWYESPDPIVKFTAEQLRQIKKATLASVICRNADTPMDIQKSVFDMPDDASNPLEACYKHETVSVDEWRDRNEDENEASTREAKSFSGGPNLNNRSSCEVNGWVIKAGGSRKVSACVDCQCQGQAADARCKTVQVESCSGLVTDVGLEAVKVDPQCEAQCPHLFP